MKAKRHSGVIVPMVSPFTSDGTIDEPAVRRLIERLVAARVRGVFVLGTTGECASISEPERARLVRAAVEAADGRLAVYAGISGNCLSESLERARRYAQDEVCAVVAHPPYYYPPTELELEAYYLRLADAVDLPLLLYNIPKTTHVSLSVRLIEHLSHHPNIEGLKDSAPEAPRLAEVVNALNGREGFSLLCGCGPLLAEALRLGADGMVPSTGNLIPEVYQEMWEAALQGRWDDVERQQALSMAVGARYQQGRSLGESLAALKAILADEGVCGSAVLPPLRTLARPERT
jgi:4-hydroxy-tetrahydrodipicolinate synthase